jgi:AcrR family transcriptional regulator
MSKRQTTAHPDARRQSILDAAKEAFSRYGYSRTSMADIAASAHVSRPALYEHFRSKEDVFRNLGETLMEAALKAAETAWPASVPFGEGLANAILAKDLEFFRLIHLSPHGAEILAQNEVLSAGLHDRMQQRFANLVARRAAHTDSAALTGRVVAHAVEGLKHCAKTEKDFVAAVRQLAALVAGGIKTQTKK